VDNLFSIETHLLGGLPHAIPKTEVARIYFLVMLRENRRFAELSSLKAQISEDIGRAEQIHAKAFMKCMNRQGGRDEG
jgi:FAD synthase